ncbi:MAG: hypothetical protein NVS9B14_03810 [Candidatus Acidiferrum sp.]
MNPVTTSHDKGDALENAVRGIEDLLLSLSPPLRQQTYKIESKKRISVSGVRHEIDVYVSVDLGNEYKSVFIFECKNWKDPVGKNEVVIFSKKIDVCQAQWGCIVAKTFTEDAENQAKMDPRMKLFHATEHDLSLPAPFEFFVRVPRFTRVDIGLKAHGSTGTKFVFVKFDEARVFLVGQSLTMREFFELIGKPVCTADLFDSMRDTVPEGSYTRTLKHERAFDPGVLFVNEQNIAVAVFDVEYEVLVKRRAIISHFEVETRGRFLELEPMQIGEDFVGWQVAIAPH